MISLRVPGTSLGLLLALTLAGCSTPGAPSPTPASSTSPSPGPSTDVPADEASQEAQVPEAVRLTREGRLDELADLLRGPGSRRRVRTDGAAALAAVGNQHTRQTLALLAAAGVEGEVESPESAAHFWRRATALPKDPTGALAVASDTGDLALAAAALRAGAGTETRDDAGRTPLLVAATEDRVEVARLLVRRGADPDALDGRHDTPWLVTGVTGSVAMGRVLLAAGADLTVRNRYGGLSVIPASERGHAEYVEWVVGTDIDLDHVNDLGWTALLEAVILGDGGPRHQRIVRALLEAGADPSIADADGVSALEHARAKGQRAVVALLEQA